MRHSQLPDLARAFALGVCMAYVFFGLPYATEETSVRQEIDSADYREIVWKIRDPLDIGQRVRLSAQHRRDGTDGRFTFVVYESLNENFNTLRFVARSESQESVRDGWSSWEFTAQHMVTFVGLAWETDITPVYLERDRWSRTADLESYAYVGQPGAASHKLIPIRANLRIDYDRYLPSAVTLWLAALCGIVAAASLRKATALDGGLKRVAVLTGILFVYRTWAVADAPYWAWGNYHLRYGPEWIGYLSIASLPLALIAAAVLPDRLIDRFRPEKYGAALLIAGVLVLMAWILRCHRVYGDWVYGFTNFTHAPLVAALFSWGDALIEPRPSIRSYYYQLISTAMFVPFLVLLTAVGKEFGRNWLLGILLVLSVSTTQVFFGYVEIYSIPATMWLAFLLAAKQYLQGALRIWVPTSIAFLAYMCHVPEALLIFSVAYVWIMGLRRRTPLRELLLTAAGLAAGAVVVVGVCSYLLFRYRFGANVVEFRDAFPYLGFETLWGEHGHAGVMLPWYSESARGMYTPPGPSFPVLSMDNLLKVVNFQLHYSVFIFWLPLLCLAQRRLAPLRNPVVAFTLVAFVVYTCYLIVAYVGWVPAIRDWDLFTIYAVIAATMTLHLFGAEQRVLLAVALLNLTQTIPWIYLNHSDAVVPW